MQNYLRKNDVAKLFTAIKFSDNVWGLIDTIWDARYENMNPNYVLLILQNNLNNVKNISSRWFKSLFEQLYIEHCAKNDLCISCQKPVYKFPRGDAYYCAECKSARVDKNLAETNKQKFKSKKKRDSNFIRTINSIRSKAGLPFAEFPDDEDIDEMQPYAVPVERMDDDDLPF